MIRFRTLAYQRESSLSSLISEENSRGSHTLPACRPSRHFTRFPMAAQVTVRHETIGPSRTKGALPSMPEPRSGTTSFPVPPGLAQNVAYISGFSALRVPRSQRTWTVRVLRIQGCATGYAGRKGHSWIGLDPIPTCARPIDQDSFPELPR